MTTFTTISNEFDFKVIIECAINTFTDTVRVPTLIYVLGDPTMAYSSDKYAYEQTPFCNYRERVSVINLPDQFAKHDVRKKYFTI